MNPLNLYVKLSRLVFSVEPTENWEDYDEFEEDFLQLYNSILCCCCNKLLNIPVAPKKNHFSCQHRVCLDCIGRKRSAYVDCQMCNDYTLFEKSSSTKLVLDCFQELCELIHSSWIYEFIKKRRSRGENVKTETNLIEVIESGMNYGKVSIVIDDTSSDESSCSSESVEIITPTPILSQSIPTKSPSPVKTTCTNLVQSTPEQISIISNEPVIATTTTSKAVSTPPRPPLVQFPVQSQMPSTSKLLPPNQSQQQQQQSFIKYPAPQPVRLASPVKSIMTPMKLQAAAPSTPQIYSVMYTGSGNKITLKRKPPDEVSPPSSAQQLPAITSIPQVIQQSPVPLPVPINPITNNNAAAVVTPNTMTTILKTDNNVMKQSSNVIPPVTTNQLVNSSNNEKRRGCRCGNATAAPGKLTCCGQRCPCYVDSKACIDCKCRGCRNPHFIDGHKKVIPNQYFF
jgi:male-specific lethal 2